MSSAFLYYGGLPDGIKYVMDELIPSGRADLKREFIDFVQTSTDRIFGDDDASRSISIVVGRKRLVLPDRSREVDSYLINFIGWPEDQQGENESPRAYLSQSSQHACGLELSALGTVLSFMASISEHDAALAEAETEALMQRLRNAQ